MKASLSVSRAFMQFAVILHECFKCHTFYSASIKTGWMANILFFKGNLLPCFTWNHRCWLTSHHLCMHTQKENTQCEQGITVRASLDTNRYTVNRSHREVFVSLSLESTGSNERLFPRSLHVLVQHARALSTHTHKHTLWLPKWLANTLRLQKNLAGRNWKIRSPLIAAFCWTKDWSFFPELKLYQEVERRCASGRMTAEERTCQSAP